MKIPKFLNVRGYMNIKPYELNKIQVAVLPKTHGPQHSSPIKPSNRLELFRLERGASASKSYECSRAKETLSQSSKKSRKSTFPKSPLQIWHLSHWRKRKMHPDWQVVQLVEWRKMLRRHLCKGPSLRTSLRLSATTATRTRSRHYCSRMERMRSTKKEECRRRRDRKWEKNEELGEHERAWQLINLTFETLYTKVGKVKWQKYLLLQWKMKCFEIIIDKDVVASKRHQT